MHEMSWNIQNLLFGILFADDTLIGGTHPSVVGGRMRQAGAEFGLCVHCGSDSIPVRSNEPLHNPQGQHIADSGGMMYLGALLTADGHSDSELSRIGAASGYFQALRTFWSHANICGDRTLQLFYHVASSRLQCG